MFLMPGNSSVEKPMLERMSWFSPAFSNMYWSKLCFFVLSVSTLLGLSNTTGKEIAEELNLFRSSIIVIVNDLF